MNQFSGIGVAVITPFDDKFEIDAEGLRKVLRHIINGSVDYVVALGTTGETPVLTMNENKAILDIFFEECEGKMPVVIGAGGNYTQELCRRVDEYSRLYTPMGFLSVSPYYNKPTQEGLFQHYAAFAESTDIPIILYNVPGRTSSNVSPETVLRLAHSYKNIVAIKEASGILEQSMEILSHSPEGFGVLAGDDALVLPYCSIGAEGVISVLGNALPAQMRQLVKASIAGDVLEARELHYKLLPLMQLCFQEGNPAGIKAIANLLGLCAKNTRLPLLPASDKLMQRIQIELQSVFDWS